MPKLFNAPFFYGEYLTAKSFEGIWENIEEDDLKILEITGKGNFKISFRKQFEAHFKDMILRHQDLEWTKITFFCIWEENKMLITQIKRIKNEITLLSIPENWDNQTIVASTNKADALGTNSTGQNNLSDSITESKDIGTDNTKTKNINYTNTAASTSDDNSQYEDTNDFEEPDIENSEEKEIDIPKHPLELNILGNQLSQNKNLNIVKKNLELTKGTGNKSGVLSMSGSSSLSIIKNEKHNLVIAKNLVVNKSLQSLQYLKMELPKLRTKLLNKFAYLFQT